VLTNSSDTVVAIVDVTGSNAGRMRITGDLKEEDTPSTSHLFSLENDSSQTVASIDSDGNLYLKGRRYDVDNH
jgi:hypothetical protein